MELVDAPVLHKNDAPGAPVAVNTEFPQLLATATLGADGIAFGAAVPLPGVPVHPSTVCFTVKVPVVFTVIDDAVAPLLHKYVAPGSPVAVNTELPQLLATAILGADGMIFGAAVPLPGVPVHPFTVCVTVKVPAALTEIADVAAPLLHNKAPI